MPRYCLTLEYDGRFFCGWQRQNNGLSVAGFLEQAVQRLFDQEISIVGAGRTDTGVHAAGQVAHFDGNRTFSPYTLTQGLNCHLRFLSRQKKWDFSPLSVLNSTVVAPDFHARFSAKKRLYQYKIINRSSMIAVQNGLCWHYFRALNTDLMQEAAHLLHGHHDFKTFQAQGCQSSSSWRTLDKIDVIRQDDHITITVLAPSFLYHQVRNIVGSLVLVGCGKWSLSHFHDVFNSKDRTCAGPTAPAYGLYFTKVFYE